MKMTLHSLKTPSILWGPSVGIREPQQHQINDMGWSSFDNSQNCEKQKVLHHMGDIIISWEHL